MTKRARGRYALAGVDPPASRVLPKGTHVQGGGAFTRAVGLGRKVFEDATNVNEKGPGRKAEASPRFFPQANYLRMSKAGTLRTLKGAVGSTLKSILNADLRRFCRPDSLYAAASASRP